MTGALLLLAAAAAAAVRLEPPPGWKDVTATKKNPDILVALRGPQLSSFVLSEVKPISLANRVAVRAILLDIMSGLNAKAGLRYAAAGPMQTAAYKNGLTVHYLVAETKPPRGSPPPAGAAAKPKLLLAIGELGGRVVVATLISTVPESLMPSLLGGLQVPAAGERRLSVGERVETADGQLSLPVPEGTGVRALDGRDRAQGMVLALRALESELWIIKVADPGTNPREDLEVVRDTLLSIDGVDPDSISRSRELKTKAGPVLVYASGAMAGGKLVAGYLPWCFWGYSVFVKGPAAQDLLRQAIGGLGLGSSAVAKLVEATPRVRSVRQRVPPWAMGLATAFLIVAAVVALGRRKR